MSAIDLRGDSEASNASGVPFWDDCPEAWENVVIAGKRLPGLAVPRGNGLRVRADAKQSAGQDGASVTFHGLEPAEFDITVRMWTADHLKAFAALVPILKPRAVAYTASVTITRTAGATTAVQPWRTQDGAVGHASAAGDGSGFGGLDARWSFVNQAEINRTARVKDVQSTTKTRLEFVHVDIYHPALALFGITKATVLSVTLPTDSGGGVYEARLSCREYIKPKARPVSTPTTSVADSKTSRVEQMQGAIPTKPSDTNSDP